MVWKVLFWIQLVIFGIFFVIGYLHSSQAGSQNVTEIGYLSSIFAGLIYLCFMISLYSLGRKKQYFKKPASILLLIMSFVFIILPFGYSMWKSAQNDVNTDPFISTSVENQIMFGIVTFIVCLIFILFTHGIGFAGLIGNIIKSKELEPVNKPYWKMLTVCELLACITTLIPLVVNFKMIPQFNFADVGAIICVIYCAIALVGYSWSKKIFSQKFWQISMPIYIVLFIYIRNVSHSQIYLDIMGYSSQVMNLISFNIICYILMLLMLFAVLKYAYTNEVYKKEEVCVEEKEQNG